MIVGVDDVSIFKVFFDVIYEETSAVELKCTTSGMNVSILDKSHTCFYDVFYENSFFDLFDVDDAEVIILDIDDLVKILKNAHKDDYLTLSSDDERVVAKFERDGNRRVFELVQVDFMESPVPPRLDTTCTVTLDLDDLNQCLKDFDVFKSGSCHMVVGDEFIISSKADASMKYSNTVDGEFEGTGDAYYTVDHLKNIVKFKKIDKQVTLMFGDNLPLKWEVKNAWVCVSGMIAPRIEED